MNTLRVINKLFLAIATAVFIAAFLAYGTWDHVSHKRRIMESIDRELYNTAVALKYILPEDFHDRATDEQAISIQEDSSIAHRLTDFIEDTSFQYVYTIVKRGETLFFVASDVKEDPGTQRGTFYFYPYEGADEIFLQAFDRQTPSYKTVTDQWGTVRTVMVPETSPGGTRYLACADYDISYVDGLLRENIWRSMASALFFGLLAVPVLFIYIRLHRKYWSSLQQSEEKYRSIFENSIEGLYQSGPDGGFISVNQSFSKIFGYASPEELMSASANIAEQFYLNPEDRVYFQDTLLREGSIENYEYLARRRDGSPVWVSSSARAIYDESGNIGHYEGNINDITERKLAEKTLKASEERYRTLFEKSSDAIFIVERDTGRYLDANEAAVRLTGRELAELKNLTTRDITPENSQERLSAASASKTTQDHGRVTYLRPDGTQRVAILTTVPLDSHAVIGIARDITDEIGMEHQLRQAQKMEAIGTLAGGIAHDFNNILSAILGYSELALTEVQPESSLRNKLEAIHSSGERARDLVSHILAFSRKDEQIKSPVELHQILQDALKMLRPAIPTTIDIQTKISSDFQVLGDPSRLHQIIMNLCTNGYHAMLESGGTLTISLSEATIESKTATNGSIPPGHYGKLVVSDTGEGIPQKDLPRIFDPYFTTKEKGKGTGLGLAAVHGIVQSHGGTILVNSKVGQGTSFEVYLPMIHVKSNGAMQPEPEIIGGQERILLVDDEPDILEVEKEMLTMLGYSITTQQDPQETLALFTENPARFDLVITDMTMSGMNGVTLAAEILKIRPDIPIILCTGFSELMSEEKAAALGFKGILLKPVTMRNIAEMIRSVLDADKH